MSSKINKAETFFQTNNWSLDEKCSLDIFQQYAAESGFSQIEDSKLLREKGDWSTLIDLQTDQHFDTIVLQSFFIRSAVQAFIDALEVYNLI